MGHKFYISCAVLCHTLNLWGFFALSSLFLAGLAPSCVCWAVWLPRAVGGHSGLCLAVPRVPGCVLAG